MRDADDIYDSWVDEQIMAGKPWKPVTPTAEDARADQLAAEHEAAEAREKFGAEVGQAIFELAAITARAQAAAMRGGA